MSRSYTIIALATAFLASIFIVAFNFIMDPYKLYPAVPGLSPERSIDLLFVMRLHTPYAVERVRPSVLIVGDSRSAPLPPQLLAKPGEIGYNASLPGATLREIRRMVEHAQAINPLKLVLIGVNESMFEAETAYDAAQDKKSGDGKLAPQQPDQPFVIDPLLQMILDGASENVMPDEKNRYRKVDPSLSDRWLYFYQRLEDYWRGLFSLDALMDSWSILLKINSSGSAYEDDGTWGLKVFGETVPISRYRSSVQQTYMSAFSAKSKPINMDELTKLLDFTEAERIQTIFFIMPMQGLLLNTIALGGAWERYLDWQRELVNLVDARNSDTRIYGVEDRPKFVLESAGAQQNPFLDGIHITRNAGIELFTCLATQCNSDFQPTRLDSHSIDSYLEQVDALRRRYAQENPAELTKARKWLNLDK
jgi:hypothetical protein